VWVKRLAGTLTSFTSLLEVPGLSEITNFVTTRKLKMSTTNLWGFRFGIGLGGKVMVKILKPGPEKNERLSGGGRGPTYCLTEVAIKG